MGVARKISDAERETASPNLRRRIKGRVDGLESSQSLQLLDNFIAFLEDRENEAATQEILAVPGLASRLDRAVKESKQRSGTPWRKLRRHV